MFVRRLATGCQPVAQPVCKPMGIVPNNARYKKIQELQNAFCREDCLLVWQKMGTRDKMMYYFTMTFMTLGFIPSIGVILKMSFPKKEE